MKKLLLILIMFTLTIVNGVAQKTSIEIDDEVKFKTFCIGNEFEFDIIIQLESEEIISEITGSNWTIPGFYTNKITPWTKIGNNKFKLTVNVMITNSDKNRRYIYLDTVFVDHSDVGIPVNEYCLVLVTKKLYEEIQPVSDVQQQQCRLVIKNDINK